MKFFVIGNGAVKAGLDLNYLTPVDSQSGNFAGNGQTLQQSLATAVSFDDKVTGIPSTKGAL